METENNYSNFDYTRTSNEDCEWMKYMPPGFRFCPTTKHIFGYLRKRVALQNIPKGLIHEFNVYQCQPSELPGFDKDDDEDKYAYFFTPRDKVNTNANGKNQKRTTKDNKGTWKATNKPTPYKKYFGKKNTLVYYCKDANGKLRKTNWIMHEYVLDDVNTPQGTNIVFCRIYDRSHEESRKDDKQPNLGNEEETVRLISDANPPVYNTLKMIEGAQQVPEMNIGSSSNFHHYYNEPQVLLPPKRARYAPPQYCTELEYLSHKLQFVSNPICMQPSCQTYVNLGPMLPSTINTISQVSVERNQEQNSYGSNSAIGEPIIDPVKLQMLLDREQETRTWEYKSNINM